MRSARWRTWFLERLPWLLYVLFALLMTWPLARYVDTRLGGADTDILNVYWGNWWVRGALATGQNPYLTRYLIYPVGFDLATFAFSPFLALLSIPLLWVVSPIVAYNVLVWITIILCCVAMDQLVRYLTGNIWAALLAGITFGFAPILAGDRAAHLNLAMLAWIPWGTLTLTRLMREARLRDALLLVLVIVFAFLTRLQVGVLVLAFLGIYWMVLFAVEHKRWCGRAWRRLLVVGLLSSLLLFPLAAHLVRAMRQPGAETLVRSATDAVSADLLSYIVPPPQHSLFGTWTEEIYERRFPGSVSFYWAYVGLVSLLLVLYAIVSRPREALPWAVTGLIFFVLALGPSLRLNGRVYNEVKLPYHVLGSLLARVGFEKPNRFNLAMMPALGALVGLGSAQLASRLGSTSEVRGSGQAGRHVGWLFAVLIVLVLLEYAVVPLRLKIPPPHSAFYDRMAADEEQYAIVDLPLTREAGEFHRYYQTIHQKPIVGGWDHRVPNSAFAFIDGNPLLSSWRRDLLLDVPLDRALSRLSEANVRYIVVHKDELRAIPEQMRGLFFALEPLYQDSSVYVLPTQADSEPADSAVYDVAHTFERGVKLLRPVLSLSTDQGSPALRLDTCWLFAGQGVGAESYGVSLIGPGERNVRLDDRIAEQQGTLVSDLQGLACTDLSLGLNLPVREGDYQVHITFLDNEGRSLGTYSFIQPIFAPDDSHPLLGRAFPATFDAPIEMLGYDALAGDSFVWVDLYWRSLADHEQPYVLFVQLLEAETGRRVAASDDILHRLAWSAGDIVHERRLVMVDSVPPGQYVLAVGLYHPGQSGDRIPVYKPAEGPMRSGEAWPGNVVRLDLPVVVLASAPADRVHPQDSVVSGDDRIVVHTTNAGGAPAEPEHRLDASLGWSTSAGAVAQLTGYGLRVADPASGPVAGQDLDVVLYWKATNPHPLDTDYKVFVHVLDESGRVIAQHDGEPMDGRMPTHTWREGDQVIDMHRVVWLEPSYAGKATIEVGLYDFQTQERVPAFDAMGQRLPYDRVMLGEIEVAAP